MPDKKWWATFSERVSRRAYIEIFAAQPSLEIVKRATFPLFVRKKLHGAPTLIATGVLLAIAERVFILTAAHVVEALEHYSISISVNGQITQIPGESYRTPRPSSGSHAHDRLDAAVFAIEPAYSRALLKNSIGLDDLCPVDDAFDVAYWVYGFPLRWSRREGRDIRTNYRCMTIGGLSSDVYDRLGYKPNTHVLMEGGNRISTVRGAEAQRATRGMSGCGAWIFPIHHGKALPPRLCAIFIEKAKGWPAFIAVSVNLHVSMIWQYHPELRDDINAWFNSTKLSDFKQWLSQRGLAPKIPEEEVLRWFAKTKLKM